ncbi:UDP-N-acetylglucosamine 2-epimerase (non-hydrolyzing) [Chelativorans sp. SCAU2101]|uniref:UDP-N-acetylglucosamine 2-epimerase (Non-hydrolyzing) n=1 Tax=Chelativorans petroleitrophicus TaxID=2975484 RepID=A0A9X2X9H5_9HYPH|nr:UDP-N-acetylglucosamine 2-epimerase (non-hydrolyzing) [Chelativorans petroleitrophicus]MCT8990924.1 UDP-N-acetylglucosamine 2-epimerase (non-hydrolyzing) [Chelativorans petroleitrophicus]
MKVLTVVGARPQFIKAIAISAAVARRDDMEEVLLHTGQHYDDNMSEVFFRDLKLPQPKYRFNLGGGSHAEMTGRQLIEIERALKEEAPDICLVYGDTNSTLAGALAAAKLHIPVAHVEAGLRSFNRRMPEEINRVLTDHVSRWLFAPTQTAVENLKREGVDPASVHCVGDVMYDVSRLIIDGTVSRTVIVDDLALPRGGYAVATLHRQENTDDPQRLEAILTALGELSRRMPVVLPLHPRTAKAVEAQRLSGHLAAIRAIDPIGFFDMATLLADARLVVTDSGGLQKEAYFHRVPCVTVREETEWVELVEMGWNRLPESISRQAILAAAEAALASGPGADASPYGDGNAAELILDAIAATG